MSLMCVEGTPVEHYPDLGLWVKREDLCCPTGPHFSKTRGVYTHIAKRPEKTIGCLDTSHSQGGWATAQACRMLGKHAVVFRPVTVKMRRDGTINTLPPQQQAAEDLGARIVDLQAGRSAVLYHEAKNNLKMNYFRSSYMMPNALKLPEMIEETVAEVLRTPLPPVEMVIISASSGTIAAGVISGLCQLGYTGGIVVHQGYSRSRDAVRNYMSQMVSDYSNRLLVAGEHPHQRGDVDVKLWTEDYLLVDQGYGYGDKAAQGLDPPFPCNQFYDLKAFRWWMETAYSRPLDFKALLWNIG